MLACRTHNPYWPADNTTNLTKYDGFTDASHDIIENGAAVT